MELTNYIAELLLKNNCVIVPNFGGFITNYQPAIINKVNQSIVPPAKTMLFNSALQSNDGLLAHFVSNQIHTTYANSIDLISKETLTWNKKLQNGERIHIGETGFLFLINGSIQFEQNREFNLLLSAYGLGAVKFISRLPVDKQINNTESEAVSIEFSKPLITNKVELEQKRLSKTIILENRRPKKKIWKYAAVACLLPALFYSYWIPMNTGYLETGNIQTSDFNPFKKVSNKTYSQRLNNKIDLVEFDNQKSLKEITSSIATNAKYYNYQFSDELYIPVNLNQVDKTKVVSNVNTLNEEVSSNSNELSNSNSNVHLIAGCFSDKSNAISLVNTLKSEGYQSQIIDKSNGLYRVSMQSFSSVSSAKYFKNKASNISTWVLVK